MRVRFNFNATALFLAPLILILAVAETASDRTVSLVEPVNRALLSDGTIWQVPAAASETLQLCTRMPFWLFAGLAAVLIVICGSGLRRSGQWCVPLLVLLGLGLTISPHQFGSVLVFLLAGRLATAAAETPEKSKRISISAALLAIVAVVISLEFGLLVSLLLIDLLGLRWQTKNSGKRFASVAIVVLAATFLWGISTSSGFRHAFLRPATGAMVDSALNSTVNIFALPAPRLLGAMVCYLLLFVLVWRRAVERQTASRQWNGLVTALVAIMCPVYMVPAVVYLSMSQAGVAVSPPAPRYRLAAGKWNWAWVGAATFVFLLLSQWRGDSLLAGNHSDRLVNVAQWRFDGPVFLTDVGQSHQWNGDELARRFPLLVNDRWDDVLKDETRTEYRHAAADLLAGLREHYQRHDGSFGGYREFLDQRNVVAVVVSSREFSAIRELSVDPVWRIMSVDADRVIFGRSDRPATASQTRRAGRLLFQLEWPRPGSSVQPEGILAVGNRVDSRRVAMVMNAIRLPYAGLRIVADDSSAAGDQVRTWCYVELANRSIRHTGRPSLLDHFRAVHGLRTIQQVPFFESGQTDLADRALAVLEKAASRASEADSEFDESELRIRRYLLSGDHSSAIQACEGISSAAAKAFYFAVCQAIEGSPAELFAELHELQANGELRDDLKEEAAFYAGCLALELGDYPQSLEAFQPGPTPSRVSVWSPLRELHYVQLAGP